MGTLDLTGQVAVVTGGGGGIGRGIAERLAAHGADVSVLDIDAERAAFVAGNIQRMDRQSMVHVVDVMDADALMTAVDSTAEHFGRIDILVNNAGGVSGRKFLEQSQRSWRRHIDINLVSMLAATHAAAPHMIAGGRGGSIVNVASIEATRAAPMFAVYAACKAGMLSFTRSMALEFSEHQIRVNSIGPDFTITPGNSGFRSGPVPEPIPPRDPQRASVSSSYIPLGREGTIEECGDLAVFLCSGMASYITGTHIPIDGGTWASSGWTASPDGKWSLFGPSAMFDSGI